MNILTFDIEEWFLERMRGNRQEAYAEYDSYLDKILELLDEREITATFFCVGQMGELFPGVIRKIQARGHEIGCHSNIHAWLNKMTESECREDTHKAIDSLEQCLGQKIKSYRAPAFSIGEKNKWAFEILAENGIERDASVYPASREFGGFPNFGYKSPVIINCRGIKIKEFPVRLTKLLGMDMAFSGGGYFRLFPLSFVTKKISQNAYNMCYFHISDLISDTKKVVSRQEYEAYFKEPGTLKRRYTRYFKSKVGKKNAFSRMIKLINEVDFVNLHQADREMDWNASAIVKL